MLRKNVFRLIAALCISGAAPVAKAEGGKFGDWSLQTSGKGDAKSCYIASEVKEPGDGPGVRSVSAIYISAWPKDGIKSEVSIKLGYAAKPDGGAKASVGKETFSLFIKDEHAFVADPTMELKLVEAMKKGSKLVIEATAGDGAPVKDGYSLLGISQAMAAQAQACP